MIRLLLNNDLLQLAILNPSGVLYVHLFYLCPSGMSYGYQRVHTSAYLFLSSSTNDNRPRFAVDWRSKLLTSRCWPDLIAGAQACSLLLNLRIDYTCQWTLGVQSSQYDTNKCENIIYHCTVLFWLSRSVIWVHHINSV